jgi:hypothetical protein
MLDPARLTIRHRSPVDTVPLASQSLTTVFTQVRALTILDSASIYTNFCINL